MCSEYLFTHLSFSIKKNFKKFPQTSDTASERIKVFHLSCCYPTGFWDIVLHGGKKDKSIHKGHIYIYLINILNILFFSFLEAVEWSSMVGKKKSNQIKSNLLSWPQVSRYEPIQIGQKEAIAENTQMLRDFPRSVFCLDLIFFLAAVTHGKLPSPVSNLGK